MYIVDNGYLLFMKVMGIGCLLILIIGVFVVVEKEYVEVSVVVLSFYGVVG